MSASPEVMQDRILGKRYFFGAHPSVALGIILIIVALSLGDIMEIIPIFAPLVASPFFAFFHEIHDLLAISVILVATYEYRARLGIANASAYFAMHIPYFIHQFPEHTIELLKSLFTGFVALSGIWTINRLHKNEQKLSVSEERYRTLVENALVGVYRTNLKGDILYVNNALVSMLGFDSTEEMIAGGAVVRYKNPSDRAILIKELTEKGKVNSFEFEVLTKTGKIKNVILNATLEGNILSGMLLDITERKQAEERIAHLTAVLRSIRNVNQLIAREKDRQSLIQQSCDLLVQRQGYERAWILLLDENGNFVTVASTGLGEKAPAFLKQLETSDYPLCVRELLGQEQAFIAYDQPGKRHEGCIFASEHSLQGVFRCKLEYGGKLYGVLGVTVTLGAVFDKEEQTLFLELCGDIAFALAKIEGEEKLHTVERRYQTVVQTSIDSFLMMDTKGHFVAVNDAFCQLLGYSREELQTMSLRDVEAMETPEEMVRHIQRVVESGGDHFETKYRCQDGRIVRLDVGVNYLSTEGLFFAFLRDITERQKMQEQIIAQDRLVSIGQLVSGVAHELNNPLTSVIGFSELLLQKELPDDVKADLKIVNDEAKRTSLIVKNLLSFARQQPQEKRAIDINEPIQTVLQLRSHGQSTNNIKVNAHFATNLPQIIGNISQLQQVFFNIVTNAEQAMLEAHNKGTLIITTKQVDGIIRVSINDDGPGISPENMQKLFTPFFTTKGVGKGTGLGLSISHGIVVEHGGKMYAESEPGEGAAFIVELPIPKKATTEESAG